jgi:predicted component of type VI protein secretion system
MADSAEGREARLFVLAGPDLARSFPVGERSTLGRSDDCDVVLRDRSISRKHALLVRAGESWFVQDLGSTNGVSKGGKRAERIELFDGDEFKLGDLPLRLRLTAPALAQDIEFAPTEARAPAPAAEAARRAAPAAEPGAGKALESTAEEPVEEEIEIEEPADAPSAAGTTASRAPTSFVPPRSERRTGFLVGDLAQQPFWLRTLIVIGISLLCAGLAYAAFRGVALLRADL